MSAQAEISNPQPLDLEVLRQSANTACRLMKTLSNPDRLLLLCQLSQGEMNVGELEALVGIVQPTLSQQLGVLRDEGLVSTRREGKNIITASTAHRLCRSWVSCTRSSATNNPLNKE